LLLLLRAPAMLLPHIGVLLLLVFRSCFLRLRMVAPDRASSTNARVAAADGRSMSQLRHGGLMASAFAAISKAWSYSSDWQVDSIRASSLVVFLTWFGSAATGGNSDVVFVFCLVSRVLLKKDLALFFQVKYKVFSDQKNNTSQQRRERKKVGSI
jgi:hypothetical protein